MRALEPRTSGYAINPKDGVRSYYEVFGPEGASRTILFFPTWSLIHSRCWKMQVPYFARRGFQVVTFDGRGNGKSDRPESGYTTDQFVGDGLAVLDAVGVQRTMLVTLSAGSRPSVQLAAEHSERISHLVLIGPAIRLQGGARIDLNPFLSEPPDRDGWNKYNAVHWSEDYRDFVEWFTDEIFTELHSTKPYDDFVGWAMETTPDILIATTVESLTPRILESCQSIRCPTLIIHGTDDHVIPIENSRDLQAKIPDSELFVLEGGGHAPNVRDPVKINEIIHTFLGRDRPKERSWRRAMVRAEKRALLISSPIGLGHVQRDLAIARELRDLVPDLQIDWLAQHPVTTVLEAHGERIHPLSNQLSGESPHIEVEMEGEHELNVFQALRNMDEILLNNFQVFRDAASEGNYDVWIGDEAWEVDYYLHENPQLKTAPFVWMTDFVGYLPMENGRESFLTADYNAEMIEHVARYPRVRDVSLYIGNSDDIVPDCFGPGLPRIRDWVGENFDHNGYIRYFDPANLGERAELRERFGFAPDEKVAVAAVGGTSVGTSLLRKIIDAYPVARESLPGLRLVVVCGPRIDPATMPQVPGVEYRGYVHNLFAMLSAADAGLVQGGLSTTMELVATGRPFIYFPLTHHFEQNRHVPHRLENYGVPDWARLPYGDIDDRSIAERLTRLMQNPPCYKPVEGGGARRAAEKIAALL
ncbi:MAG: alpha/beta fold hydrolase [Thermomicrobiales bacterium]